MVLEYNPFISLGFDYQGISDAILSTYIFVASKSDFPAPSGGVITLADNATYFITDTIDLTGDRLVGGQNTTIIGGSSENCRLKSTGNYIEVWCANNTSATDITVDNLNLMITQLG